VRKYPSAEVCFYNINENAQIKVAGKATLLEDMDLKKGTAEQRPFLKSLIEKKGFRRDACFSYL
jgi:uncharacterized pyridoxamine 5'-phosphate oxidase family protein